MTRKRFLVTSVGAFALVFFAVGISTVISTEPTKPEGIYLSQSVDGYFVLEPGLMQGIKVEKHIYDDFMEFRGSLKDNNLILEYSPGSESFLDREEWSGILEFRPSQIREGDWDLIRHSPIKSAASPPSRISPLAEPIIQALHRIDDQRVVQYLKTKEPSGRKPLAQALLKAHPDDEFIRALYLQEMAASKDLNELSARLADWKEGLLRSPNLYLQRIPEKMEYYEHGLRLSAAGKNAFDLVQAMSYQGGLDNPFFEAGAEQPGWDLNRVIADFPKVMNYEDYVIPHNSMTHFLDTNFKIKALTVIAVFKMIEGKRGEALNLLAAICHLGQLMREVRWTAVSAIGAAFVRIGANRLQLFAENCCDTDEELRTLLARIDAIKRSGRPPEFFSEDPVFAGGMPDHYDPKLTGPWTDITLDLARMTAAAKYCLLATGAFPMKLEDFSPLLPDGLPLDAFTEHDRLKFIPGSEPFVCYSVGPDGKDDLAAIKYDPSNGTVSGGDIFVDIPREREFPFPRQGTRAASASDLLQQYPNGLPTDPCAYTKDARLAISNTEPVYVFSFGPDRDESARGEFPEPEVAYDPTNGITSNGDIIFAVPR